VTLRQNLGTLDCLAPSRSDRAVHDVVNDGDYRTELDSNPGERT